MTFPDAFLDRVRYRVIQGARTYGDASFDRPTGELLDEIQQELEDVCGWSAVLWARIERLRERVAREGGA